MTPEADRKMWTPYARVIEDDSVLKDIFVGAKLMGTILENNFSTGPWRCLLVPDLSTKWDQLLTSLKVTETDARRLLKQRGTKALRIRLWIERNHRDRFIPPQFLTPDQAERFRWD